MNDLNQQSDGQKHSDKSMSRLLATHTSRIQCDHCGLFHHGESHFSLEDAYQNALNGLEYCRSHHARRKQAMAYSVINQGVTLGLVGRR